MKLSKAVLILLVFFPLGLLAQQNLQSYTPSILFGKGEWEFKTFQNVYTQTRSFDGNGVATRASGAGRQTWSTSINQFLFGINDQINVGVDVWVKNVSFAVGGLDSRTEVVGIGPKIKIAPFKNLPRLSVQSTFLIPGAKDLEGSNDPKTPFLETDRKLWLTQVYFDKPVNDRFQLFFQQAFWYSIVRDSFAQNNFIQTQTSAFLSFFPTSRWTIYAMSEFFPTHYNSSAEQTAEAFYSFFVQSGIGAKYQLIPQVLEAEVLFTDFWMGSNQQGAGQTFNLGLRYIRQ